MLLSAFFPTLGIGNDPAKIRDWGQAAEHLGYHYIEVPDHVFSVTARDGWKPLHDEKSAFHETFTTLAFLAAWGAAAEAWRRLGAGIAMLWPMYRITLLEEQI